jgi:hypothetical protein
MSLGARRSSNSQSLFNIFPRKLRAKDSKVVKTHHNFQRLDLSRRGLLRGAALVAGGGVLVTATAAAAAQTKLTQKAANYQATPKGNARCNVCSQWVQPTDCKIVVGPVSPTGWCNVYAAKW